MKTMRSAAVLLFLVPAFAGLSGCFNTYFNMAMSQELKEHGVTAEATILDIWDTGWTVNDNPVIGMHVDVRPADRPPFQATINRCVISRLAIPRYQPGKVIPVRFDPQNPAVIAVDVGTGNPYHDQFVSTPMNGAQLQPPPSSPTLYRGTSDADADDLALLENGYAPLGVAVMERGGGNPQLAGAQGKEIGAALVVVYGPGFDVPAGGTLQELPFHASDSEPAMASQSGNASIRLPKLPARGRLATYWGKNRRWVFGLYGRELNAEERNRLKRDDGVVAAIVPFGSPAAAAHIAAGDVIVSFDGKPVHHSDDLSQSYLMSMAGKRVAVELVRDGAPLTVTVQLNPPAP
jgi:hypothetical protein